MNNNENCAKTKVPGVIGINEGELQIHLSDVVRNTVEEILDAMFDSEADELQFILRTTGFA